MLDTKEEGKEEGPCAKTKHIINWLTGVGLICAMAALVERPSRDSVLPGRHVFVFCIMSASELIPIHTLSCLSVRVCMGHIGLTDKPRERRLVYFADNKLLERLDNIRAPVLIIIKSSCDFEVNMIVLFIKLVKIS